MMYCKALINVQGGRWGVACNRNVTSSHATRSLSAHCKLRRKTQASADFTLLVFLMWYL